MMLILRMTVVLCLMPVLTAADRPVVPLYPGAAPGTEGWDWAETERPPTDGLRRIANVTKPALSVFLPDKEQANGTGVVVCPGGGFRHLAIQHEGEDVARWLNAQGVAAFVLKYRLMRTGDEGEKDKEVMARRRAELIPFAVADGLEAMRLARSRAAEWGVRDGRIGILGFSAGGWVATAVTLEGKGESRPDFSVLIYAAMPEVIIAPGNPPPVFLVHADDDTTVPTLRTSVRLYSAWKQAGASAELHIYAKGGHGFGMRTRSQPVDRWVDRLREWMAARGLTAP